MSAFGDRASAALKAYRTTPDVSAAVAAEVDAFFAEHPDELRDAAAEQFIAALVFTRVTARADESAPVSAKATK